MDGRDFTLDSGLTLQNTPTYHDLGREDTKQNEKGGAPLEHHPSHVKEIWKFHLRPAEDDEPQDWWFASTAIPLLAATLGPMANVTSIAALVSSWRDKYPAGEIGVDDLGIGIPDPTWCINLNIVSLVFGFVGNFALLLNFTRRIRYIVALPVTIFCWYIATSILIGIMVTMNEKVPPKRPEETYSQAFWHAVIASVLYLISSMILMINMLGYFLGHYPQHFELTDEQRNLILQTMMFFVWLAGGAGIFCAIAGWSYSDALYFADVTILTVGFGDFYPPNDVTRGVVFPYSVGGIVILGLMVSSIMKFAKELGHDKVLKKHVESQRVHTLAHSFTNELKDKVGQAAERRLSFHGRRPVISAPFNPEKRTINFDPDIEKAEGSKSPQSTLKSPQSTLKSPMSFKSSFSNMTSMSDMVKQIMPTRGVNVLRRVRTRNMKLRELREEKDRFDAMRDIQASTKRWKAYNALFMSFIAFGLLWCVGAVVFWKAEKHTQDISYFEALYFCYVSLLTIGYGDLSPRSNAGKPFFVVWSLVAVPTMTILISDLGDTLIASYKRGTFVLADWTIMPQKGIFKEFLEKYPWLIEKIRARQKRNEEKKRIQAGFQAPDDDDHFVPPPTLEDLAEEDILDEHDLARKLALAIRRTAAHLHTDPLRRYSYEEWVEYTRLIRFSKHPPADLDEEEEEEGLIEWDWMGLNSPMLAEESEAEWILDRLCESLARYMKRQVPEHVKQRRASKIRERDVLDVKEREMARTSLGAWSRRNRRGGSQGSDVEGALGLGKILS